MSFLKTIATNLYRYVTTDAERQVDARAELTAASRSEITQEFLAKEALLLDRRNAEYYKTFKVAEGLVLSHYDTSSLPQLARIVVRRTTSASFFETVALSNLISRFVTKSKDDVNGLEASALLSKITPQIAEAAAERNPIKRRSIVRKAIAAEVVGLTSDQLNFAVELVISIAGEFRAQ